MTAPAKKAAAKKSSPAKTVDAAHDRAVSAVRRHEPPETGDAQIDAALDQVRQLEELPLSDHHDVLSGAHDELHQALHRDHSAGRFARIRLRRIEAVARLDVSLVQRGLARSRTQAQALIASGVVSLNGTVVRRPAEPVQRRRRTHRGAGAVRVAGGVQAARGAVGPRVDGVRHAPWTPGPPPADSPRCCWSVAARRSSRSTSARGQLDDRCARRPAGRRARAVQPAAS